MTPFAARPILPSVHLPRRSLPRASWVSSGLACMLALGSFFISPVQAQQIVPTGQVGVACAYNSALPTLASGNYGLVQCDSTGHLLVSTTVSVGSVAISGPLGSSSTDAQSIAVTAGGTIGAGGANSGTGLTGWFATLVQGLATLNTTAGSALATQAPTVSIGGVGIVDSAGTNVATVKAASTLPVAADKTLVVGLNPGTATAGSPTGAIVTVQGVSGGTAAPVSLATAPALVASSAIIGKVGIDQTTPGTTNAVVQTSQYPAGATAQSISATGTTGATTATLGGAASNYTFLCGFSIRANATAAATNNATVTGTVTGTLNFTQWTAPLASGLGVTEEIFTPCIPSASTGTSQIAVVSGAPGAGGIVSVTAWGYYKTTTP